jgi:tetratricopeptide (TPR) repeat protein
MLANSEATLDFTRAVLMEGVRNDETITMDELRSRSEAIAQQLGKNDARTRAVAANFVADWYISMNQFDKAEKLLTRTIDSLPADRHFLSTSSLTCARASAWAQLGRNDEAIAVLTREIERNRNDAARITFCLQVRAEIARASGDTKGALAYNLQALRRFDEAGLRSLRDKAVLLAQIGAAYSLNNTPDQAHAYFGQSFRLFEQTGRADSLDAGAVLNNWGTVVFDAGDPLRARALFERAIAVKQRRSPTDEPPEYATANIAYVLRTLARYPEATAAYDTLQRLGERSGNVSSEAYALVGKARIATLLRHFDQAQDFLNVAAAKILEGRMPAGDPAVRGLKVAQGQVWAAQGRLTDAAAILTEALDSYAKLGCCSGTRSQALIARAGVATANHQLGAALDDAQQALELAQKAQGRMPFSFHTGNAWLMLGRLHQAQGRGEEARQAYALAAQHLANTLGGQHPDTLQASRGMATVH